MVWIEKHNLRYKAGYFLCDHCSFKVQIFPYRKVNPGTEGVFHSGSHGMEITSVVISLEIPEGEPSADIHG